MSGKKNKTSGNTFKLVLFLGLTGAIVAGLVGLYTAEMEPGRQPAHPVRLSLDSEKAYARALEQHLCPCGSCNLVLAECTCNTAVNVKKDTRKRLSSEDVVEYSDIGWILENIHKAQPTG